MNVAITVGSAALGAGVGALLPLPAYRLSRLSQHAPAAGCPHCEAALPVPNRGWIGRGSCPDCRGPLTPPLWRYGATGALAFALLVWRLPHGSPAEVLLLAAWLLLAAAGILFAAIDLHAMRLPLLAFGTVAATIGSLIVGAAVVGDHPALAGRAAAGAAALGFTYLTLALLKQVGMGDVLMAALTGLLLGLYGWGVVFIGAILQLLLAGAVVWALLRTDRIRHGTPIPFVPYLVAGTLLAPVLVSFG